MAPTPPSASGNEADGDAGVHDSRRVSFHDTLIASIHFRTPNASQEHLDQAGSTHGDGEVTSTAQQDGQSFGDVARGPSREPPKASLMKRLKQAVKKLKKETLAMYYAMHDPECPWIARIIPFLVLAYALSPLDLIPDFIPVLGILDDLLLLPAMIWVAIWVIPTPVMQRARHRADVEPLFLDKNWPMAVFIFLLWLGSLEWLAYFLCLRYGSADVQRWMWWGMGALAGVCTVAFVWWMVAKVRKVKRKREKFERGLRRPLLAEEAEGQQEGGQQAEGQAEGQQAEGDEEEGRGGGQ